MLGFAPNDDEPITRFRIILKLIKVICVICEICGLKTSTEVIAVVSEKCGKSDGVMHKMLEPIRGGRFQKMVVSKPFGIL